MKAEIGDVTVYEFHPEVLAKLGPEVCKAMMDVARDLRSGKIKEVQYNQTHWVDKQPGCKTSCCIAGWTAWRLGMRCLWKVERWARVDLGYNGGSFGLDDLFNPNHPSNPKMAADAIENYLLRNDQKPWKDKEERRLKLPAFPLRTHAVGE